VTDAITASTTEGHAHVWQMRIHMDGCHQYSNHYQCACGAHRVSGGERQFYRRGKPTMSILWVLEDCERCNQLLARARRRPSYDITVMPDGTEIRNKVRR
jgi:hypothetical protein